MMLGSKQRLFVKLVGSLIGWAYSNGYELTFGETVRSVEEAKKNAEDGKGITNSLHVIKLAVDLNLFKDGVYQTSWEAYTPLGTYWKTLDPLCRWGGDFKSRDADHFSVEHEGVQ